MTRSGAWWPRATPWIEALLVVGLTAVAANRVVGSSRGRWLLGAQAVTRWALLPTFVVLPLAALRRRPAVTAAAGALACYQLVLTRSARGHDRPDPSPSDSTPVRLVSANLLLSNPDVRVAVRRLLATPVDILVLQELTPEHLSELADAGLLADLPHTVTGAEPGFHGAGLFSRWPLHDGELMDLDGVPLPVATVRTPDGPLRVAVVHAKNPGAPGELARWQRQLVRLAELVASSSVPVVLVGDFNATADHRDFRRLLARGLRDAWDVAGRGSGSSWPVWRGPLPPLLRLDHALVGHGLAVLSAEVADTPSSDHRHLRVELRLATG